MNREVIVNTKQALVNRGEREVRVLCYHCQERCQAQEWNEREAFYGAAERSSAATSFLKKKMR